jgi:hypothetical protein
MLALMTKSFARWAGNEKIADRSLWKAIREMESGLIEARLGSGLIKKRVARSGSGKSGGYRTIIAYRHAEVAIFLFGFAKSEQETMTPAELAYFRELAAVFLSKSDDEINAMIRDERLYEVRM